MIQHIAIIPDGNRRWAKNKGMLATAGHAAAIEGNRITAFIQKAIDLHLKYISLWAFSTENWKREQDEVDKLMDLMRQVATTLKKETEKRDIKFVWAGRRDRVPQDLKTQLEELEQTTKDNNAITFQLCLDYGGRDELTRAINKAIKDNKPITEDSFEQYLDTKDIPDPDLIIRTSGEQRLSGLFSWQSAYSELYFTQKHFPDFTPEDLEKAINDFKKRTRRFGGNV